MILFGVFTIWVHFKRNYNLFDKVLINVITLVLSSLYELGHACNIWIDRNYFLYKLDPQAIM